MDSGPILEALRPATDVLQQRIRPGHCSVRWVEAAYWSSDRVLAPGMPPVLLLGDAACGKPFYSGTTLNRHLWDVAALVDEVEWLHDGQDLQSTVFEAHERRYQVELRRVQAFHRDEPSAPRASSPVQRQPAGSPKRLGRSALSLPQLACAC